MRAPETTRRDWRWQTEERGTKRWRYDYDWLVEKHEAGWSVADIAWWDNCAIGTAAYHLERAGVEGVEDDHTRWGPLCDEFRAAKERKRAVQKAYRERRSGNRERPKHEQATMTEAIP